ncbi:SBBP repeat-containing protein [Leptolyngbya sp. FACHB-671]|uniref:SBBP repeat-containing protein n=1 Tax=Leptolyngbya sp. FACHB-671 TaxID=2692812 RepID=UPI001686F4C4|nr:SBBP repeat-containing protein [Leptolyngbya sp. FACHB-671]MBD2069705.1 SBBP repeat-containing protein [Leptolyngbya sp. FACHB-671]
MNTQIRNAAQRLSNQLSPLLKQGDRSPLSSLQLSPRSQSSSSLSTANTNQVFNRRWIEQLRLDRNSLATDIVTDRAGNVYVSGNTVGLTGLEESDIFVAKYSANGKQLWFKQFGSDQLDGSNDIAVDQKGNVYVTGYWDGAELFSRGSRDAFVVKYDTQGEQLWFRRFGAQATTPEFPVSSRDEAYGVATDR